MFLWQLPGPLLLVAACIAAPTEPAPSVEGQVRPVFAEEAVSQVLVAPGQLISLQRSGGDPETAWFEARIVVGGGEEAPAMDGAILVVSAADGPMPQSDPDAEWFFIRISLATVGPDGVVRFAGVATWRVPGQEPVTFEITGTATPQSAYAPPRDTMFWDILGGKVHLSFEATDILLDLSAKS